MTAVEHALPVSRSREPARLRVEAVWLQFLVIYLLLLMVRLPALVAPDSWLAFVAGREIVQHGLPSADHLTLWAAGTSWTDQQWLGQLMLYGLVCAGGLRLALAADVALLVLALGLGLAAARRFGASPRSTAVAGAFVLFAAGSSTALRTETLAYPLFAGLVWLLLADARAPSPRVLLAVPLLALWANIHGSVVLGAALAIVWGAERLLRRPRGQAAVSSLLVVGAGAAVFASPYAASLPAYYEHTIGNDAFPTLLSEWAPATLSNEWRFYLLAGVALVAAAAAHRRGAHGTFAIVGSAMLFAASVHASRNVVWFALFLAAVLPVWLDRDLPASSKLPPRRFAAIVWLGIGAFAALAAVVVFSRTDGWYGRRYPIRAIPTLRGFAAMYPSARILATDRLADWLLWTVPATRGRLAYDSRFELLTPARLRQLRVVVDARSSWPRLLGGYRLAVLEREKYSRIRRGLLESGARLMYEDSHVSVLLLALR